MFVFLIIYDRDLKTLRALPLMIRLEKGSILTRPPILQFLFPQLELASALPLFSLCL